MTRATHSSQRAARCAASAEDRLRAGVFLEPVLGKLNAQARDLDAAEGPAGFGPGGLPIGLQVMGAAQADLAVLQLGHAYEQACGYGEKPSPLLST